MEVDKEKMLLSQDKNADGRRMIPLEKFGWVFLNEIGFISAATMTALMIIEVMSIKDDTLYDISAAMTIPHGSLVFWIHYKCRGRPNRLVGRYGRAALDIFSLCAAVLLHVFFPYDGSYLKKRALVILVGLTLQLHGWGQSFHLTWDIGIDDFVVQALMERMIPLEKFGWVLLNEIGFITAATTAALMIIEVMSIKDRTLYQISAAMTIPHGSLVFWIHYKCRGLPNRLVGRYGRAVLDIFSLCAAVMLHVFFPYDGSGFKKRALVILVGLTLQLHGWGQSLHLTWDIGIDDFVVQALMEVGTYLSGGMTCIFLLLLFCCVIWYRFYSYSIPSTPENIKKDLGPLAC